MAGEASGGPLSPEAQGQTVPPVKEGEQQTSDEQIKSLIDQLNKQNQELGGMMMFSIPLGDESRNVPLFMPSGDEMDQPIIWGVHPDKGPIGIRGSDAERLIVQFREMGIKTFKSHVELNHKAYRSPDFQVGDHAAFEGWTGAYNKAKDRAVRLHEQEMVRRQWVPKALEVVSRGSTSTATASLATPPPTAFK